MYTLRITNYNDIIISNTIEKSNKEITIPEDFKYCVEYRPELINKLITWIAESKDESNRFLMKEDLQYLMNLKDDYLFSSNDTNEYIAESDKEEEFNKICEDLLLTLKK